MLNFLFPRFPKLIGSYKNAELNQFLEIVTFSDTFDR
jgi:hypothetical protein